MQISSYIVDREPLKYGGFQEDYQRRMSAIVSWGSRQIKEAPKNEKALVELFFRLLERFMQERQAIARDHKTPRAEQFGHKRNEEVETKEFYFTILKDTYKNYNQKILNILANHLREMSLESKQTSQKKKRIDETYLDRSSSFEIEVFEQEDLVNLKWIVPLKSSEYPAGFPLDLREKIDQGNLSSEEWKLWKQAIKKLKEGHPLLYKRIKMLSIIAELQKHFPSPLKIPSSNGIQLIGNEANLKSIFVLATVRLQVQGKSFATTQYFTWLYRDFVRHPVDRMLECSTVMLIHQDNFLIDDTLQEIAVIFAKAVLSIEESQNELEQHTGILRDYFAQDMPCERGSVSIAEMFEGSIYGAKDLDVKYNSTQQIDLETLTSPLLSIFMKNYRSMRDLEPKNFI